MSHFKEHLWAHILGGLVVVIIVGVCGFIFSHFGHYNPFTSVIGWICLLVVACLMVVGLTVFLKKKFNHGSERKPEIDPLQPTFDPIDVDFHILRKEIFYEYKNLERTQLFYCKKVIVRALKHGLECYRDKYLWTGRGKVDPTSGIKGQVFRDTIKKNVWQFYEIAFNRALNLNEEIDAVVNFELHDPEKKAVPFFSATIEEPTDFLVLELKLPEGCGVDEVVCEESCSIGARKPYQTQTKPLRNGKVRWEVPSPKLLHFYEVKWNFPPET